MRKAILLKTPVKMSMKNAFMALLLARIAGFSQRRAVMFTGLC
jgi:hypothetical protein